MIKKIFYALLVLLLIPAVSAEATVTVTPIHSYVIKELSLPAEMNVVVANHGTSADYYSINTMFDMQFSPDQIGVITPGSSKGIDMKIYPSQEFKDSHYGNMAFEYYVKGENTPLFTDRMTLSFLPMKDFVEIDMPSSISVDDSKMTVRMRFKDNLNMDAGLKISSKLFDKETTVKLTDHPFDIEIPLDLKGKDSGVYKITFGFTVGNETAFAEKDLILGSSINVQNSETVSGSILSKEYSITRTNNGNTPTKITIEMNKTIWTSLFTSAENFPTVSREGTVYIYQWEKDLNPGESFTAVLRINYYIPFLIFILIIVAFAVYRAMTASQIEVKKSAVRVKTKSGLFASKILLSVKNKGGPVSNLKIIDRLPAFTELLPERFGILEPTEVRKRSLIWEFPKLDRAEEIMFSYIVYSKVTIFGKLEVPAALATFVDKAANAKETFSNKVFILADETPQETKF